MTRVHLVLFVFLVAFGSRAFADRPPEPSTLEPPPEVLRPGFAAIEEADLRSWLAFLASDELEGRESGRRGFDVAARFSATVLERFGVKPAGDGGTYFQDFDILQSLPDPDGSGLTVKDSSGTERFALEGNLAAASTEDIEWTGRWSFAGHGEGAEQDAPSDFRGLPVEDRVVMVLPRPGRRALESRGAANAGAARIAVISDERVRSRIGLEAHERPAFSTPPGKRAENRGPEIAYITSRLADRILRSRGLTVEGLSAERGPLPRFDLDGVEVRLTIRHKEVKLRARNVVGILEGSDAARRGEAVAIGAHLDHIGQRGSEVFRGADDDASGSAGVLGLARAFAGSPRRPARSVLFLLFAAEEKGLWGSKYFVDHPAVPLRKIMAEIQLDMIGRNEEIARKEKPEDNTNSVYLVGTERSTRDLRQLILSANRHVGLRFKYDREDVYGSSDQFNFGEKGVPVSFFFTGFHPDYHRATDTPEKINYLKMVRILRVVFATAWDLAEREERLRPIKRL